MSFLQNIALLIFSVLISLSASFCIFYSLKKCVVKEFISIIINYFGKVEFENHFDQKMEQEINFRLNEMVLSFKKEIPMISMFLSEMKEKELKQIAKNELIKLIPALKKLIVFKDEKTEIILNLKINQIVKKLWKKMGFKFFLQASVIGISFGIIEIAVLFFLS